MGGELSAASEPRRGSTFTVALPKEVRDPVTEGNALLEQENSPTRAARRNGMSILVIDDDATVRDLVQRALGKEGFQVHIAADGKRGLELAKELKPAAITLDVMMPGMDGWAVLTSLKADPATAGIPVIMMTIVDDKNLGFALGAADYFAKPIDWQRLTRVLNKFRKPASPQTALVVEDDPNTREMLRRTLQKDGWQVAEAANGRLGLEQLASNVPALILLDLMMPEMDGFEFLEALRKQPEYRDITVLVLTAKDITEEDRRLLNGGVERIIQKSDATPAELLGLVRELLPHPGREAQMG